MKNFFKIIILSIISFGFFSFNYNTFASTVSLKPSATTTSIGGQFYVDVMINPDGKIINGVEGNIAFDSTKIKFIHAEEASSQISFWIEHPSVNNTGDQINFSGIIPNGFGGVIDPFNQEKRFPGQIIRLVFEGKESGIFNIGTADFYATLNDGQGTIDKIDSQSLTLKVSTNVDKTMYESKNITDPTLVAEVVKDENLNNNKYTLVFDAKDEGAGIKEVLIKEGNRDWKKIESPYLLIDQSRNSIITLQATNYKGQSIAINIESLPYNLYQPFNIFLIFLVVFILIFLFIKAHEKYKK